MYVKQQVSGKFNVKDDHTSDQLNEFSTLIAGPTLNQYLLNQKRGVSEQIQRIKNVKGKLTIVPFSNDVVIIDGDMGNCNIIALDILNALNKLQKIGREYKINNNISKSYEKLESGQTALGPASVVSIAMAESPRGSQVILRTDGLANVTSLDAVEADKNAVNANVNINQAQTTPQHAVQEQVKGQQIENTKLQDVEEQENE